MIDKIALEEHFVTPALEHCIASVGWDQQAWRRVLDRLADIDGRLEQIEALGIEIAVLSLGSDGIQGIREKSAAIAVAHEANDALADIIRRTPERFRGFAALPMQDPQAAAAELERCMKQLGFVGALINGYSDTETGAGLYYDGAAYLPFWETVVALEVPVYLHPRNPLERSRGALDAHPELRVPTWAFAVETGTHALGLITSGLFDRLPGLRIILGHLGEFLPFAIARLERRMSHVPFISLERPPREVLRDCFYITVSGNYHTPSLIGVLLELGADRILVRCRLPIRGDERRGELVRRAPDQCCGITPRLRARTPSNCSDPAHGVPRAFPTCRDSRPDRSWPHP